MANTASGDGMEKAGRLPGLLFLLVMLVGAASLVYALASGRVALPQAASTRAFMDGETAREVSEQLAEAPFPKFMAQLERGAGWLLMGNLGPRVREGCSGWLFLADELAVHPRARQDGRSRLRAAAAVNRRLAAQGVELLLVLVPDKSRSQHEQLCGLYRPAAFHGRLRSWAEDASAAGLRVLNLEAVLGHQARQADAPAPFLRTDTHWSETGAELAARHIAAAVASLRVEVQPQRQYSMERGRPSRREGDLVRLAGVDWLPPELQPAPEWASRVTLREAGPASGMAAGVPQEAQKKQEPEEDDGADLFGDEGLPNIALIGTSFSRTSSFLPYLDAALETRVTSFARDGGDFWAAARYYFSSPSFLETPPRVLIWEIPERVLEMPLRGEECAWLAGLLGPDAGGALECTVK